MGGEKEEAMVLSINLAMSESKEKTITEGLRRQGQRQGFLGFLVCF